jgi:hypothetical protein
MSNDNPTLPKITPADLANPDVVATLERALAQAKAGKIAGVAVIMALGPDALRLASGGAFPSTIVAGCQQLSRQILDGMFSQKPRSSIVIPQRRM